MPRFASSLIRSSSNLQILTKSNLQLEPTWPGRIFWNHGMPTCLTWAGLSTSRGHLHRWGNLVHLITASFRMRDVRAACVKVPVTKLWLSAFRLQLVSSFITRFLTPVYLDYPLVHCGCPLTWLSYLWLAPPAREPFLYIFYYNAFLVNFSLVNSVNKFMKNCHGALYN